MRAVAGLAEVQAEHDGRSVSPCVALKVSPRCVLQRHGCGDWFAARARKTAKGRWIRRPL